MGVQLNRQREERKPSALELLAQGLTIAHSGFGIAVNYNSLRDHSAKVDKEAENAKGIVDKNDQAKLVQGGLDVRPLKQGEAIPEGGLQLTDKETGNPLLGSIRRQSQSKIIREIPGVNKAGGQETQVWDYSGANPVLINAIPKGEAPARRNIGQPPKQNENNSGSKAAGEQVQNFGKRLTPVDIERFGGGRDAITQLVNLSGSIESNKDIFGPFSGRVKGSNPYDTKAQSVQSQVDTAKQVIGKFLEGGVLRKEDEYKYEKILPKLSDTPDVASEKIKIVAKTLRDRQDANIYALKTQGYDARGVDVGPDTIKALDNLEKQSPKEKNSFEEKAFGGETSMSPAAPDPEAEKLLKLEQDLQRKAAAGDQKAAAYLKSLQGGR